MYYILPGGDNLDGDDVVFSSCDVFGTILLCAVDANVKHKELFKVWREDPSHFEIDGHMPVRWSFPMLYVFSPLCMHIQSTNY